MTDVKLSFVDLQRFLIKDMKMQANYQPIMIRTLLNSPQRTATKDEIAEKIRDLNSDANNKDFKNIPVYDVLTSRGIVKRDDNKFLLNIEELSNEQTYQLSVLCNWKTEDIPLQNQIEDLIKAFDKNRMLFNPDRSNKQDLEKLRTEFVSDYSVEKISKLKLDEYVPGKPDPNSNSVNKSTFCYRLEREMDKLSRFGIRKALDFGIYYSKEKQKYVYQKGYSSEQEIFDKIKTEITNLLEAGRQYNIDHDSQQLLATLEKYHILPKNVRSKILSVYYPEDFLHIHSFRNIQVILETFGIALSDIKQNLFLSQIQLLEIKKAHPIMSQWSIADFSHFAWRAIIDRFEKEKKGIYNHLLLLQQPNSKWNDKEGEEYEFGDNVFNYRKVVPEVFVIFRQTKDAKGNALNGMKFFGHGKVSSVVDIVQDGKTLEGKDYVRKIAHITDYRKLEITDSKRKMIESKIRNLPNFNKQNAIITIPEDLYQFIIEETNIVESNDTIKTDDLYERIRQESMKRNLEFKAIPDNLAVKGFYISNKNNEFHIYGNILSSTMQEEIWQGITNRLYSFYDSNGAENFVVISDKIHNHFLSLPFEILKPVFYEQKSGSDINKNFNIRRDPYQLTSNNFFLSQYVDNIDVIFALATLVEKTHYKVADIKDIERQLLEKGQFIFYGPPGTGKTFVAEAFGIYFTKKHENVEVVQFHPSYSYEDFIEGLRPNENGGFSKKPGIFKRFADKCSKNPNERFVLIIDEINRGDIAKIFGELIHLLPYRDKKIILTYSSSDEDKFGIPSNLYIIATMNSQDRTIAFLDYANRRRFSMKKFYPDMQILRSWLEQNSQIEDLDGFIGSFEDINEIISLNMDEDFQIGHSYFMENNIDYDKVKRIIKYDLEPLVEQYFYSRKDEQVLNNIKTLFDKMLECSKASVEIDFSR